MGVLSWPTKFLAKNGFEKTVSKRFSVESYPPPMGRFRTPRWNAEEGKVAQEGFPSARAVGVILARLCPHFYLRSIIRPARGH